MCYTQPTVAVIDNDRSIRAFFEDLLGDTYTVATFACSHKSLTILAQVAPALIILDLGIPGSNDGWNMLYRLRKDSVTAATPIIICSTDKQLLERSTAEFCRLRVSWQDKPFDVATLLSSIALQLALPIELDNKRLIVTTTVADCDRLLFA